MTPEILAASSFERWSLVWYGITAIATALYAVLVVVAALVAVRQVRESKRSRHADLSWLMFTTYCSPDIRESRSELEKLAHSPNCPTTAAEYRERVADDRIANTPTDMATRRMLRFYNQVGILLCKRLIDGDFVHALLGHGLESSWRALEPAIDYYQRYYSGPDGLALADVPRPIYNEVRTLRADFKKWAKRQAISSN